MFPASQRKKPYLRDGLKRRCLQIFERTSIQWGRWHQCSDRIQLPCRATGKYQRRHYPDKAKYPMITLNCPDQHNLTVEGESLGPKVSWASSTKSMAHLDVSTQHSVAHLTCSLGSISLDSWYAVQAHTHEPALQVPLCSQPRATGATDPLQMHFSIEETKPRKG